MRSEIVDSGSAGASESGPCSYVATAPSRTAGINAFARERREDSLKRLREAADAIFSEQGYLAASVDQIATRAGISRQTLYRLFDGKLAIAMDFFDRHSLPAETAWVRIGELDFRDPDIVRAWARNLLDVYTADGSRIRVFHEMGFEKALVVRVNAIAGEILGQLGKRIPAFAGIFKDCSSPAVAGARPLIFLQQAVGLLNASSSDYFAVDREALVQIFAENFLRFVDS